MRISRRGPGKLNIEGDVRVSGLVRVLKGVKIDGYTLEKYIEMQVMKALNPGQFGMAGPDFCCNDSM